MLDLLASCRNTQDLRTPGWERAELCRAPRLGHHIRQIDGSNVEESGIMLTLVVPRSQIGYLMNQDFCKLDFHMHQSTNRMALK